MDYWRECIAEAFEDAKIEATDEQITNVAGWAEGAHDNFGTATGQDCIPNPETDRAEGLKRELEAAREELRTPICAECNGKGSITTNGPAHSATSECYVCRGSGRAWPS